MLGVDTDSTLAMLHAIAEALPLRHGVERNVIRDGRDGIDFIVTKCGGVGVDFTGRCIGGCAEIVVAELRFVDAAGGGAGEIFCEHGKG